MASDLLTREPIAEFGEFRAYLRSERQEMVFEAFRESDGRAWLLRVPLAARAAMTGLLREAAALLADERSGTADPGILRQVALGPKDALAAVLLEEGRDRAFALWRREQLRVGMGVDHRRGRGPARTRRPRLRPDAPGDRADGRPPLGLTVVRSLSPNDDLVAAEHASLLAGLAALKKVWPGFERPCG